MIVLGIETSCDETSAAVIKDGFLMSNVVLSQEIHKEFGGVVPEIASREHEEKLTSIIQLALDRASVSKSDLDAIGVTYGAGLMGALLVGLNVAKGLAIGLNIPFILSALHHALLPALTMILVSLGGWMLSMRNNMITTLGTDYISFAHAKGLSSRIIMLKYAARNAILPNFTGFGMALGFVLSGALLTEIIFSYPGQGYLLLQAVRAQDFPLMQGLFMTITFAVLAANWLVDIAIVFFDPRTRK